MIGRQIENYDIEKLRTALRLCREVSDFYYLSANSRVFLNRLLTITKKLEKLIIECEETTE